MKILYIIIVWSLLLLTATGADSDRSDAKKTAADYLLEAMDQTVDPCNDFFKYACGNWQRKYGAQFRNEYEKTEETIKSELLRVIKGVDEADSDTPAYKKHLKIYLEQCANSSTDYDEVLRHIYNATSKLLGSSMPLIEPAGVRKLDPYFVIGRLQRLLKGMDESFRVGFVQTTVTSWTDKCPPKPVLTLAPVPALVNGVLHHLGGAINASFPGDLVQLGSAVGNGLSERDALNRVNSMLTLMGNMTKFLVPLKPFQLEYHRVSRLHADVNEHVNWLELFRGLLPNSIYEHWIQGDPEVLLYAPEYFRQLHSFLDETEYADLLDYSYIGFLYLYMTDYKESPGYFAYNHSGWTSEQLCLEYVNKYASPAAARIYLESTSLKDTSKTARNVKHDVGLLSELVFSAFRYLVQSAEWLDEEAKSRLIKRVNSIDFYSGIPDWVLNDTALLQHTPPFERNRTRFENDLRMLDQKVEWAMTPLLRGRLWSESRKAGYSDVGYANEEDIRFVAYVHFYLNQVRVMLGQLLPPRYNYEYPLVLKFGSTGADIAHTLFTAYTPPTSAGGGITSTEWLKEENVKELQKLSECVRRQYSAYCFPEFGYCLSASDSLWSNIAYMEGIKIAYMAYKFSSQTRSADRLAAEVLPGMEHLTSDQLFFISLARPTCYDEAADINEMRKKSPDFVPMKAMLEVSLMNFPAFAESFNCRAGAKYAPLNTCTLWGDFLEPNIEPVKTNRSDLDEWD